jgi:hypothetical protein
MVWPRQKGAGGENTGINYRMNTTGKKEKKTSKKNVDGRSKSSYDNKKFRNRSMEKQRGMAFGFRKTATAVIKQDRQIDQTDASIIQIYSVIKLYMFRACRVLQQNKFG